MADRSKIVLVEKLFKEYQPMLVAFAYNYVRVGEDAREIVQEVFISVWKNADNIRLDGNVKSYLFTATKNKCLNFLDKRKLSIVSLDTNPREDRPEIQISDHQPDSQSVMETAELQGVIFDEINKLPPKCREIFILSREEQLSYKEIAEKLSVSTKTVENQIGIALKRLRKRVRSFQVKTGSSTNYLVYLPLILTFMEDVWG